MHPYAFFDVMPKVEVVHMSSPVCHWSWGYEPVINRLRMRYGKQIDITVGVALPYTDRAEWLKDYGMSATEAIAWVNDDVLPKMGMPIAPISTFDEMPASTLPQGMAVKAAGLVHGPEAEARLSRALMFAAFIEGKDTSDEKVLVETIESLGLDNARMSAVAQTEAPGNAMGDDAARAGHGANFFAILVRDASGTVVSLPYAYDAARIEDAIKYLSRGKVKPRTVKVDVAGYVRAHATVPLVELQKVFALTAAQAKTHVAKAERARAIERVMVAKLPRVAFYRAIK